PLFPFLLHCYHQHLALHSFPTRRSSDLPQPPTSFLEDVRRAGQFALLECNWGPDYADPESFTDPFIPSGTYNKPELAKEYIKSKDRKSTRLNSSHVSISYAVFCLKKKKK